MEEFANKASSNVIFNFISRIEETGIITSDKEFIALVEDLLEVKNGVTTLGNMEELANAFIISKLESKLPPKIKWEWSKIVVEQKSDTSKDKFDRLLAFLLSTRIQLST